MRIAFGDPARPARSGGASAPSKRPSEAANGELTPPMLAAAHLAAAQAQARSTARKYEIVRTLDRLKAWIARANDLGMVAIDTETTSLDPMQAQLCGFSLAVADNEACYVPLGHAKAAAAAATCSTPEAKLAPDQIPEKDALEAHQAAAGRPAACSRSART